MPTASSKSVATRLALRPGHTLHLINQPARYLKILGPLPPGARVAECEDLPADRVQVFVSSKVDLDQMLPVALNATKPTGALWVSYPTIASGKSDLSRQIVHDAIRLQGWKPVAQISVDRVWSAIRARPAEAANRIPPSPRRPRQ
jgi:hypothetical protein